MTKPRPHSPEEHSELKKAIKELRVRWPKAPDDVLELVARAGGTFTKAAAASKIPDPLLYVAANGKGLSQNQQRRLDEALPLLRKQPFTRVERGDMTRMNPDDYPTPLNELIKKMRGVMPAARAIGDRTPHRINAWKTGLKDFGDEEKALVKRALAGEVIPQAPPTRAPRAVAFEEDEETGEMGIAIVLCEHRVVEAIDDAGKALGGKWIFRNKIEGFWLTICKLPEDKLKPFKALVKLVAKKVVTP